MRKPCDGCPWASTHPSHDNPFYHEWRKQVIDLLHRITSNLPPVQGCHNLTDKQVPLAEHQHACIGHLNQRLKEAQQNNDEELVQELSLLHAELNG